MKAHTKRLLAYLRSTRGDTVDKNLNTLFWGGLTLTVFLALGGLTWYVVGSGGTNISSGTNNVYKAISSQQGLNTLAQGVMSGGTGTTGFTPANPTTTFVGP
ncbi:MAG: hypothetical protein ACYCYO_00235 [Bacilli bacterium]